MILLLYLAAGSFGLALGLTLIEAALLLRRGKR